MRKLFVLVLLVALSCSPLFSLPAQNSGKRIRLKPSPAAARCGSALQWETDLDAAIARAEAEKLPVFWYLPTVRGSFMDRKAEIDYVQLAGPFSWPRTIALIQDNFVPLRLVPSRDLCKRFDVERYTFVEPGFLILDAEGKELFRESEITTLHPGWYASRLRSMAGLKPGRTDGLPTMMNPDMGQKFLYGFPGIASNEGFREAFAKLSANEQAEALHLRAAGAFWAADEDLARTLWTELRDGFPDHPLAAKAAMEIESHGGIVRGQEVYGELDAAATKPSGHGTRVDEGAYTEEQLWQRGVDYLLSMQRMDGGWKDSIYDFGGTDGLPNVQVAVSAICARALLERATVKKNDPRLEAALIRALHYLLDESNLNTNDTDELIWAYTYRAQTLARWLDLRPQDAERLRPSLQLIGERLLEIQRDDGSWSHEYSNPFVTAEGLIALDCIRDRHIEVAGLERAAHRGVSALLRCRTDEGAYTYGNVRAGRKARASIEGGVGRIPLGELALNLWDAKEARSLEEAVAASLKHEKHLLQAQKYDDHTRAFAYGGFFFWYDLHARTEAMLAANKRRMKVVLGVQREQIIRLAEIDGAFIDSHEIGRCYGTGMALWCLALCSEK
ncbi:MAG TPA: hypothetical protein EYG26_04245 [Planctomycetes bacterium]|nr:hypothetical protein [Planctomycetota bacterium]